jgi:methionyl-tRNA formyltransferase
MMAGDAETGVTIMRLTEGLDSGPIALQEATAIDPGEDYGTLSARLAELGGKLLTGALDLRAAGDLALREQEDALATYAEKIGPEDRRLEPARPAAELERTVRALTPHIGAHLDLAGGETLRVLGATAEEGEIAVGELDAEGGGLRLGCGDGVLRLEVVQPPGKRPMAAADYLRGHRVPPRAVA